MESGPDYRNLDIPVFYHRIGTQDIVNSRGAQVLFPPNVPIDSPHGTINAPVQVGRATFFPNQPTQANVNQGPSANTCRRWIRSASDGLIPAPPFRPN